MLDRKRRLSSVLLLLLFQLHLDCALSMVSSIACSSDAKLGQFSRFIPLANQQEGHLDYTEPLLLDISIKTIHSNVSHEFTLPMDTGSTGVAMGAQSLGLSPDDLHGYPRGVEYLSSSHILYEGQWIDAADVNLTFTGTGVTAKVPILAVTERSTCTKFVDGECAPGHKENVQAWPDRPQYLGE